MKTQHQYWERDLTRRILQDEVRYLRQLRLQRFKLQISRLFHPKRYYIANKRISRHLTLTRRSLIAVAAILIISIGYVAIADAMPMHEAIPVIEKSFTFGASDTVTVTNTPFYTVPNLLNPPSDLTANYITLSDVALAWQKGTGAVNTEIVVNYDHYPVSRTDGYVAYNGTGTNVDDTAVDPEQCFGNYYISAWSEDALGNWTDNYTIGEVDMTALVAEMQQWLAFALLVALNTLVFWQTGLDKPRNFFWVIGAIVNIIVGLQFAATDTEWSITWTLGFLIVILGLYCLTRFTMWAVGVYKKSRQSPGDKREG